MPTPRQHSRPARRSPGRLVRLAAISVVPAFAFLGACLSSTFTVSQPVTSVSSNPVIQPAAPVASHPSQAPVEQQPDLGATGHDPDTAARTEAAAVEASHPVGTETPRTAAQRPGESTPSRAGSADTTRPRATQDLEGRQNPDVSRREADPTQQAGNADDERLQASPTSVNAQGASEAPTVTGPRNPGRAELNTATPTQAPSPSASTEAPAPTTQAPAPTTSAPTTTAPTTSTPTTSTPTTAPAYATVENLLFAKINDYRVANGVAPLVRNSTMDAMSRNWSTTMATTGVFAHNPEMGSQTPSGWTLIGENVAYCSGYSEEMVAQTLFNAWVNSTGHRANMLNSRYTAGSMGVAKSASGAYYATQNFARF